MHADHPVSETEGIFLFQKLPQTVLFSGCSASRFFVIQSVFLQVHKKTKTNKKNRADPKIHSVSGFGFSKITL